MRLEFEGVRQGAHHRLLADQVGEGGRPIFAGQHAIGGRRRRRRPRPKSAAPKSCASPRCWGVSVELVGHRSGQYPAAAGRPQASRGTTRSAGGAEVGGWTETRPVSLGLLPSGPDPVGEWCVHRQPPGSYLDQSAAFERKADSRPGPVSRGPSGGYSRAHR